MRPDGEITRGTTNPSRLRRVDRWIAGALPDVLRASARPLVVDLGFGASPVTTLELYRAVRAVVPAAEVTGLEIDPARVAAASRQLAALRAAGEELPGLSFGLGGFELPLPRRPVLVRAFNVLRQYREDQVGAAWSRMRAGLAAGGVLVEGTCDEIGRRAVWVTLPATSRPARPGERDGGGALVTFSARTASLGRPSELAERLPKALIHRNVPGEPVYQFLRDFDRAWAAAAPYAVFGPRQRWLSAVAALSAAWPVLRSAPLGGPRRWRLGEVTLPWTAVAPSDSREPGRDRHLR
ncbi:MAG TPA: class I SAM-dependent methyltransferase [Trebonia sp.]